MELILALVISYCVQRSRGVIDGVTGPNGLLPALGGTSRPRDTSNRPSRTAAAAGAGVTRARDSVGGWWTARRDRWRDGWTQGTERAATQQALSQRRRDFDRDHAGPDDSRSPLIQLRDRRATCPWCGHGGVKPPQWDCCCDACSCSAAVRSSPVTPPPAGGDGPAASTDPTDPTPTDATPEPVPVDLDTVTTPTEGDITMTAPTAAPSAPIVGEAVNLDMTRSVLAQIGQQGQAMKSTVDQLAMSLTASDMDAETLADVASLMDLADAFAAKAQAAVEGINARHSLMEEAVNATPHVAKTSFYQR